MSGEAAFFAKLDRLCSSSEYVVDRPRASRHPCVPDAIYPVDYGYLGNTTGGDGEGVDVFRGSAMGAGVVGIFLTADLVKRDVEVKVLLDCTDAEIDEVGHLLRVVLDIGGMLVARPVAE